MSKFPGWRTMTSAQRHNAKAEAIFAAARSQGHTGFNSMTIFARDVKVGDVLEGYGRVEQVETHESNIQISYERDGNWGDFAPDDKLVRMNP